MNTQPTWQREAKSSSIHQWTDYLHLEAKRLFDKDKTHGNMLFCFNEENGLIAVNSVPPGVDHNLLNTSVRDAVIEHNLYGVILICESWAYFVKKENDHTIFQLLDGEMKVSDLNDKDRKEILLVRMENCHGDCAIYWNEIIRNKGDVALSNGKKSFNEQRQWFG